MLSLTEKGELGHMPAGESNLKPKANSTFSRVNVVHNKYIAFAASGFSSDVVLTKQQLQHYGCKDREARKLTDGSNAGDAKLLDCLQI